MIYSRNIVSLSWASLSPHESLVVTVNMAGSPLDSPSILFDGHSTYILIQVQTSTALLSKALAPSLGQISTIDSKVFLVPISISGWDLNPGQ